MNTKSPNATHEIELPVKIVAQKTVLGSIYPLTIPIDPHRLQRYTV